MKVFNGKMAADDYMSSHTLTFSTPELTLTRFAFWLGDMVPDPKNPGDQIPRIIIYVEEMDFAPSPLVDDETFVPSGAVKTVGSLYGSVNTGIESNSKFCSECGTKLSLNAKLCTECGINQD
jgi:hypothetical protein